MVEKTTDIRPLIFNVSPADIIQELSGLQHAPAITGIVQAIKNSMTDANIEVQIEVCVEGE